MNGKRRPAYRPRRRADLINSPTTSVSQLPDIADVLAADDWDALANHVDGTFVLVVKTTGGHYRRCCFLSVKAAENAARRAQERGHNVVVVLAELKPVFRLLGGGPDV